MWKQPIENMKLLVEKQKEKGPKKNIENLIVFLVLLVVTIIAMNTILKEDTNGKKKEQDEVYETKAFASKTQEAAYSTGQKNDLEERLEFILSKIEGAGQVKVLITYFESSETVAMYNENQKQTATEEADTGGGTRTIHETDFSKEVVYKEESGEKIPVTQKILSPKMEGAIIIAEGAKKADVKACIIQAIEAATGLATHKIQVFPMQG